MRSMLFASALMLAACAEEAAAPAAVESAPPQLSAATLPITDRAGNRMEALTLMPDGARWCSTRETWCAAARSDANISVSHDGGAPVALPATGALWPSIIVSGDGAILGVIETEEQAYSGGGARVQQLKLFQVSDGRAVQLATLPHHGSVTIRACFDGDDETRRAGACVDEYRFVTRVRLDDAVTSGAPRIVLETAAATHPGRVTRQADSLERPPLTQADLVWARDEVCSYRRIFSRSPAGGYSPDIELPACADYLEP